MKKKLIVTVVILVVIGALVGSYFLFIKKAETETEDKSKPLAAPVPVKVTKAAKGDLPLYISSSGKLEAIRVNDYISEVSGNISVKVREGQKVQKGKLLFTIDNPNYQIAYENALLEYKKSYIQYLAISENVEGIEGFTPKQQELFSDDSEVASIQKEVIEGLKQGTISRERIKYRLGEQELNLKRALEDYKKCAVKAPFPGVIGKISVAQGEHVQAGTPVLTIADVTRLRIKANILVNDISNVKEKAKALIFPVINDEKYKGRVYSVNPLVYDDNSTYAVVELDNKDGLLNPGIFCDVLLQTGIIKDKIIVPKQAVLERDGKKLIFEIRNDLAYWVYVKTGEENYENIIIEEKVDEGDTLIIEGHYVLNHKAPVIIVDDFETEEE